MYPTSQHHVVVGNHVTTSLRIHIFLACNNKIISKKHQLHDLIKFSYLNIWPTKMIENYERLRLLQLVGRKILLGLLECTRDGREKLIFRIQTMIRE